MHYSQNTRIYSLYTMHGVAKPIFGSSIISIKEQLSVVIALADKITLLLNIWNGPCSQHKSRGTKDWFSALPYRIYGIIHMRYRIYAAVFLPQPFPLPLPFRTNGMPA